MADNVGQADIRGLDIDKTLKGFALTEFVFKNKLCTVSSMSGDQVRWYQETSTDLTATTPSRVANMASGARFAHLEHSWTRNTSYYKKYGAECFITMEDMKGSDIDVYARTLLRLTRAVAKQVDTDIWNVITENQTAVNINSVTSTAAWDAASGQNPVEDILEALQKIEEAGYDTTNAKIVVSPKDKKSLLTWLITTNGDKATQYSSDLLRGGEITRLLGKELIVNVNVTADYAAVVVPGAATWKSFTSLTSAEIEEKGIGSTIRVWEHGITLLTDPKMVTLISNTAT